MSITVTTDVFCDSKTCISWVFGTTAEVVRKKEARRVAKMRGWERIKADGRLTDVCPWCRGLRARWSGSGLVQDKLYGMKRKEITDA